MIDGPRGRAMCRRVGNPEGMGSGLPVRAAQPLYVLNLPRT
jgi:hypothetical protein